ncbi:MAG TPA: hypothetical protein VH477_19330 [Bryobacteraceae bacterium]|jgi:hypothetical protein
MASARQVNASIGAQPFRMTRRNLLFLAAGLLAAVCALAAFLFLVVRDHGHTKIMVHDQAAPAVAKRAQASASHQPSTAVSGPSTKPDRAAIPAARNAFQLHRGSKPETLGPLRLRLTRIDQAKGTYDVSVISGRRSYSHRNLKIEQPLWITLKRGSGAFGLVVTALDKEDATGYWMQSQNSPHVNTRTARK